MLLGFIVGRRTLDIGQLTLAAVLTGCLLSSCATRPKTYTAPDASKVHASAKRLAGAIDKAGATAARAKAKVVEAQQSADRVASHSVSVINQVNELVKLLPLEFQKRGADLKATVEAQQAEEGLLVVALSGAWKEQAQLENEVGEVKSARIELEKNFASYQQGAVQLAVYATGERGHRITAEKQLLRQKVFGWLWKIGGGFVVIGVIVLGFLWFTGRIALSAAKVVS